LFIFCVTIGLTVAVTFYAEPVYMASSQILVKIGRKNVYIPARGQANPIINSSSLEQINSEMELIKSKNLHESIIKALGPIEIFKGLGATEPEIMQDLKKLINRRGKLSIMEEALLSFQKSLRVDGIKNSRIIQVGFKHNDPGIAALVTNKLVDSYLSQRLKVHEDKRSYAFFKEQTEFLKNKIRKGEKELTSYREKYNIISLSEERNLLLGQKSDLLTSFNQTKSQQIETEKRINQLSRQLKATPEKITQGEVVERNPLLINTLESRLVELELEEKELLLKYTDENRLVKGIRNEIRAIREKLIEQESKHEVTRTFGLNLTYQRLKEQLFQNEVELQALNAKIITQTQQFTEYKNRLEEMNKSENKLNELQNELTVDRENYRLYLTKFEENRISSEMDSKKIANIIIIKHAKPPIKPVSPNVILNIAIGFGLAVVSGIGFPFLLESLRDNIERPEDVENFLNVPVLASVAEYKS